MSTDIKSETLTGTADTSLATSAQVSPLIASGRPETSSSQHDERRVPSHPARPQRPRRWAWIGLIGLLGCVADATGWLFA